MKILAITLAALSAVACAALQPDSRFDYRLHKHIVYKNSDAQALDGDLYLPEKPGLHPAVVVVHGGGWTNRSGDMTGISERLARAGFAVFNITYRLAPEHRHPAQVNDVSAALQWLYEHAEQYQVDKNRIAGWGYSAGAHLILLAGLDRQQPPFLDTIVAGGTPADLTAWPESPLVLKLIGKPMAEAAAQWRQASPVNHVTEDSPPVFLYHGQWDLLVQHEQMGFMAGALREKQVPVETYTVNLLGHIGTYALGGGAEKRALAFLRQHLAAGE